MSPKNAPPPARVRVATAPGAWRDVPSAARVCDRAVARSVVRSVVRSVALSVALPIALSGCFSVNATIPGALRGDVTSQETQNVGTVEIKKTNTFMFWGLTSPPPADFFEKELREQVRAQGGDGVAELKYESEFSPPNILIGCITCGILAPRDFRVSGNVVRITKGTLVGTSSPTAPAAATSTSGGSPAPPPMMMGY